MHKVLLSAVSGLAFAARAFAAAGQLVQVDHFGPNPTDVAMFVYKPAQLASPPPLIMAMHYCGGTAQAYFTGTQYANLADTHGFIIIYPNSPPDDGCWDVNTNATLTHNAGGDSLGIVSQVRYAIANYGVDPSRVFATGTSSGAMMTNVRMGAYLDVFAAGSAFSGVPYGCFAGQNAWNTQSVNSSRLPKNGDTTLYLQNFWEDIKQWTNVFNVSQTPTSNITNDPLPGYSRASFGPNLQAILAQGVGHTVLEQANDVLNWFGLSDLTPGPVSPTSSSTSAAPTSPPGLAQHWNQCGGIGYAGPTGDRCYDYA
ncbi:hypothetical protein EWM64_g4177 [Hericium alpestre]|uniref:Uncharacterized protein n=1 Tax=Hericium alpestre TaxID=135208 RepID=A0A4Z0A044_9AGAM|nr:hypothetical protein EWM64_g4177 [Hericium alpestre]